MSSIFSPIPINVSVLFLLLLFSHSSLFLVSLSFHYGLSFNVRAFFLTISISFSHSSIIPFCPSYVFLFLVCLISHLISLLLFLSVYIASICISYVSVILSLSPVFIVFFSCSLISLPALIPREFCTRMSCTAQ